MDEPSFTPWRFSKSTASIQGVYGYGILRGAGSRQGGAGVRLEEAGESLRRGESEPVHVQTDPSPPLLPVGVPGAHPRSRVGSLRKSNTQTLW